VQQKDYAVKTKLIGAALVALSMTTAMAQTEREKAFIQMLNLKTTIDIIAAVTVQVEAAG